MQKHPNHAPHFARQSLRLAAESVLRSKLLNGTKALEEYAAQMAKLGEKYSGLAQEKRKAFGEQEVRGDWRASTAIGVLAKRYENLAAECYSYSAFAQGRLARRHARKGDHFGSSEAWKKSLESAQLAGKDGNFEFAMSMHQLSLGFCEYEGFREGAIDAAKAAYEAFKMAGSGLLALEAGIVLVRTGANAGGEESCKLFSGIAELAKSLDRMEIAEQAYLRAAEYAQDKEKKLSFESLAIECRKEMLEMKGMGKDARPMQVSSGYG